tara:strand:+ start:431 stop:823 length:393 start_codon:yes stop_codon:yes gene_type:complete
MATTTATITINSGDLTGDPLSLSTTATLYKGGQTVGLENTSGVGRLLLSTAQTKVLFDDTTVGDGAHKVYIANKSTDATHKATIKIQAQTLGDLYAGDWMFIPWNGADDTDISVVTSDANMVIESMLIFE